MSADTCRVLRPLVWIIAVIFIIGAMKLTSVVTMPLGLALFLVILAWPMQQALEKRIPRALSYALTLAAILLVFSIFIGLLVVCANSIAAKAPEYEQRIANLYYQMQARAPWSGIPMKGNGDSPEMASKAVEAVGGVAKWAYELLGAFTLTVTFLILGLIEVHSFRRKFEKRIGSEPAKKLVSAAGELSGTLQRYMLARTIVSGSTGLLVGLFTWAIGLDFALVWGVMAFLLNYIPILGSIIAVIPPTLIAFIQPDAIWMGPATLAGLTVIQFTIGNYIDPQLEGHILSLSPIVLFFSIVFWGWVWGIPGALMGIPITATLVIFCRRFDSTEWIAHLFAKERAK